MSPAGSELRPGERDAKTGGALAPHEVQQRPPPAPEVEHSPARPDADLLGHVLVLATLSLLEAEREVAAMLRAAEVRKLSEAEPEDTVGERVGEVDVVAVGHQ